MPIKLSFTVITKNEEKCLAQCLDNIRDVADEIVVVDSGSTDRTMEIAKEKADVAIFHEFEDFAKQYNYAASITKYPWMFNIDADELLTDELKERIRKIKNQDEHPYLAYCFPRKTFDRDGKLLFTTNSYPGFHYRLYNRDKCWVRRPVHCTLEVPGKKKFYPEHFLHYPNYDRVPEKEDLYTRMKKIPIEPRPKYPIWKTASNFWWHFRALFLDLGFLWKGPRYWKHGSVILIHLAGVRISKTKSQGI